MAIYLGNTLLTGGSSGGSGGGGSSVPIGSYSTFHRLDHSSDDVYTDSSGSQWLKTGVVNTDTASYPESTPRTVKLSRVLTYNASVGGNPSNTGGGFIYDSINDRYSLIGASSTTFWRHNYLNVAADGTVSFSSENQFFHDLYGSTFRIDGVDYVWDIRKRSTGNGQFRGFTDSFPSHVPSGSNLLQPGSTAVGNAINGNEINGFSEGDFLIYSHLSQTGNITASIINIKAAADAGSNIETSHLVTTVDGYAVRGGAGLMWTIEGPDYFSARTETIAIERSATTGVATGNTFTFPGVTVSIGRNSQGGNAPVMSLVIVDGTWYYYDPANYGPANNSAIDSFKVAVGDEVAKYAYVDLDETTVNSTSWSSTDVRQVAAGSNILRSFEALPLYTKIGNSTT